MRQPTSVADPFTLLDRGFALGAIVAALGVETAGAVKGFGLGDASVHAVMFATLGLCAFVGVRLRNRVDSLHRGEVARVQARLRLSEREPERPAPARATFGGTLATLAEHSWRALTRRRGLAQWGYDMTRRLTATRKQAASVAATMLEDARLIATATSGTQRAEREMLGRLDQLRVLAEGAPGLGEISTEAARLAEAVRAVTVQTEHATANIARLAETVFATQGCVTAITDSAACMVHEADAVRAVLGHAETLALNMDDAGGALAGAAGAVKQLAQTGAAALGAMLETARELQAQSGHALRQAADLADSVQVQNEFGHALSHAAMVQADAVGRMIGRLNAVQDGAAVLQVQVRDFQLPEIRLGSDVVAQQAVERLPGYAEAMAQLLRDLPDFKHARAAPAAHAPQPQAPAAP
jgi:L-lactate utilization protein LutC